MKRDLDLLRNIMKYLEENLVPGQIIKSSKITQFGDSDEVHLMIAEHIKLLLDDNLIETLKPIEVQGFTIFMINRITSKGHDFLDALRSDTVWNKTKEKMKEVGGFTLGIALEIAKEQIKKLIS